MRGLSPKGDLPLKDLRAVKVILRKPPCFTHEGSPGGEFFFGKPHKNNLE